MSLFDGIGDGADGGIGGRFEDDGFVVVPIEELAGEEVDHMDMVATGDEVPKELGEVDVGVVGDDASAVNRSRRSLARC